MSVFTKFVFLMFSCPQCEGGRDHDSNPTIDTARLCCKSQKSSTSTFPTLPESLHQHQQGTKATLVPFALKLKAAITQRFVLCAACHPAGCWVPPLPSLSPHTALSVLKKRGKTLLSRVDIRFQFLLNLCRMHAIQLPKAHVR